MADRRVTVLAGGVGGARFLQGLIEVVDPAAVTIVGNVGDDLEPYGLHVSPDLDTVLYTLTGRIDAEKGWGVRGDTPRALEQARALGAEAWFWLGDLDLGLHMARTEMLRAGLPLSAATARLADRDGAARDPPAVHRRPPADDDHDARGRGRLPDVLRPPSALPTRCFGSASTAPRRRGPAPGVLDAIAAADVVVIAPSNPFISIDPILAVPGIRAAVERAPRRRGRGQPDRGRQGAARAGGGDALDARARDVGRRRRRPLPVARRRARDRPRGRGRRRPGRGARPAAAGDRHDHGRRRREAARSPPRRSPPPAPARERPRSRSSPLRHEGEIARGLRPGALVLAAAPPLRDGDVVVVAHKAVAKSEGRVVDLADGRAVGARARAEQPRAATRAWPSSCCARAGASSAAAAAC